MLIELRLIPLRELNNTVNGIISALIKSSIIRIQSIVTESTGISDAFVGTLLMLKTPSKLDFPGLKDLESLFE